MALSEKDREEIGEIIRTALKGECMCGLSHDTQAEMGHFFGRVKDLGRGNLNVGIESFSKAVGMMVSIRSFGEKLGGRITIFLFLAIASGIICLIGTGAKHLISTIGK